MADADRSIVVEILGRMDQLESALADSEKAMDQAAGNIDQSTKKIESSFDRMGKQAMNRLVGLSAVIQGLQTGLQGLNRMIEEVAAGERELSAAGVGLRLTQAVEDTASGIPVVRELVGIGKTIGAEVTGIAGRLREVAAEMERIERSARRTERFFSIMDSIQGKKMDLEFRLRLVGLDGEELDMQQVANDLERIEEEFQDRLANIQNASQRGDINDAQAKSLRERAQRMRDLEIQLVRETAAAVSAAREQAMLEEAQRIEELELRTEMEAAQRIADRIADLDQQIHQQQLRIEGRHFEARLAARMSYYDSLIAQAEDAEERIRLITLRSLEEQRMLQEEAARNVEPMVEQVSRMGQLTESTRTATGAFRFAQARTQMDGREPLNIAKKSEQHLAKIVKNTSPSSGSQGGFF